MEHAAEPEDVSAYEYGLKASSRRYPVNLLPKENIQSVGTSLAKPRTVAEAST